MQKIPLRALMRFVSPACEERWHSLSEEEQDLKLKKWALEDALEDAYYNEIEERRDREATEIYKEMTERWNALSEEEKELCTLGLLEI